MADADVIIVGGGIVGLATAHRFLERFPNRSVLVLEKEASVGAHQTGHNSGVLHSGIYYKPGSLRALNCREGKRAMEEFCRAQNLPFDICGKVIVAVSDDERPALERIFDRGLQNGVRCEQIGPGRLKQLEPHAAGVAAIHVPEAGIVNYRRVAERMAELIEQGGGRVLVGKRVTGIEPQAEYVRVRVGNDAYTASHVVTCAGLHSDRIARLAGQSLDSRIVPFRGEYYDVVPAAEHLCRNLIYPVPDSRFPFLGVHFTRMIDGGVECGPNAVLAFAREGYRKTDVNLRDLAESLTYGGFLRLAAKYWRMGLGEMWRSWSKAAFVRALQRLIPEVRSEDLVPARAGVRAQALAPSGDLVEDFLILEQPRAVHVCNAPSPAATSSLNIGKLVVDKLAPRFE
ncbi:MAG: L-2-hydroxyglutarate oxidase [Pirellulales bacterium]